MAALPLIAGECCTAVAGASGQLLVIAAPFCEQRGNGIAFVLRGAHHETSAP
jgi:hypothetical protein